MHHNSDKKLATKSNSANPVIRSRWGRNAASGRLTKRLNDKVVTNTACHYITKRQDHASEPYDKPISNKESIATPLWPCINCTFNNSPLFSKCQLCNTPNYSLNIKPKKEKRYTDTRSMTLADHLPQTQYVFNA